MAYSRPPGFTLDRDALMEAALAARIAPTVTAVARALDIPTSTLSRALNGSRPGEELLARLRCKFGAAGFARMVALDCARKPWCGPPGPDEILVPRRAVVRPRNRKG